MNIPTPANLKKGYLAFQMHEKRDSMYRIATFLLDHFWGKPLDMADSLGVLLLTWNHAFYRYGVFDFEKLEACLSDNLDLLSEFRKRDILSYSSIDDKSIEHLFDQLLDDLKIHKGKREGWKSPVAVGKALHLLAPVFFPLWDYKIAKAYGCSYSSNPSAKYLLFLKQAKEMVEKLQTSIDSKATGKTLLKLIDEYNYAKYTQAWI